MSSRDLMKKKLRTAVVQIANEIPFSVAWWLMISLLALRCGITLNLSLTMIVLDLAICCPCARKDYKKLPSLDVSI